MASSRDAIPSPSPSSPAAAITFLFTDIESSTARWEAQPAAMRTALARHDALLRDAIARAGGTVFKAGGDGFCAAFTTAADALGAAVAAQRALHEAGAEDDVLLRVRMALYTGVAEQRDGDYFGPPLNRAARLRDAGHGGQLLVGVPTRELVSEQLPPDITLRDLGEYHLRDLPRPERIYQAVIPDVPADFPPLRTPERLRHNLPAPITSFVNRERLLAALPKRLRRSRLITLTGPGGSGKTRLAVEAALRMADAYPDGVWLVDFAPLADPGLVPKSVAAIFGLQERPDQTLTEVLAAYLAARRTLLIFDNCEHLIEACAELANRLLHASPSLRLLATSREPLHLSGEAVLPVPPLTVPEIAAGRSRIGRADAVRLFVSRAAGVRGGFRLTGTNAQSVAAICRQLDGIPLALELAAARANVLDVEHLAARLEDRFQLLTGGSRVGMPRQQTLRAAFDWSYDLLSPPERTLLARLSVFAGGWTLEAVEAICGPDVLDLLGGLVDKSLVIVEDVEGEARYRLLETTRQYAEEKLTASGHTVMVRARHRNWFLAVAERSFREAFDAVQTTWAARLEREHDNLRAALKWSKQEAATETWVRLAGALGPFWHTRGHWREGMDWLTRALANADATPPDVHARALGQAGRLACFRGDITLGIVLLDESLTLYRRTGDRARIGWTAVELGDWLVIEDDPERGATLLGEGLAICRELGDELGTARALLRMGQAAYYRGDWETATVLSEESVTLFRKHHDQTEILTALRVLASTAMHQRQYDRAEAIFAEVLPLCRQFGTAEQLATMLVEYGLLHTRLRRTDQALAAEREALILYREGGTRFGIANALVSIGSTLLRAAQPERAARLLGADEALREAITTPLPPSSRALYARIKDAVRTALGEERFTELWNAGRALPLDDAVAEALDERRPA